MSKNKKINDPVFYTLANNISKILEKNGVKKVSKSEFTRIQKAQVERMMELEEIFRKSICSYKQSDRIYQKFLIHIKIEKGNILTARPYFRENMKTFGTKVSPAFKIEDINRIKDFHLNYKFLTFIKENWSGNLPKKAQAALDEHHEVRQKIIENSMPLAINQAMRFYRATPKNHVTLMDMINWAIAGLCVGTDKWVGPFNTVFRSVCISRMKSNIMDMYNQTLLHYYPSDKKIIYKSNLLKTRNKIEDSDVLLEEINKYLTDIGDKREFESHELDDLLNGTNVHSVEMNTDEDGFCAYDVYEDAHSNTEEIIEEKETIRNLKIAYKVLNILETKVVQLKGVDV